MPGCAAQQEMRLQQRRAGGGPGGLPRMAAQMWMGARSGRDGKRTIRLHGAARVGGAEGLADLPRCDPWLLYFLHAECLTRGRGTAVGTSRAADRSGGGSGGE